jgi:hypothetical protein
VWLIVEGKRPLIAITTERYEENWVVEFSLIAPPPLTMKAQRRDFVWKPRLPAFEDRIVSNAVPSERSVARRQEMAKIAGRFTAAEFFGEEGRRQLRLLSRPLWQYDDEKDGVLDGALFTFANGTNPETLLALEARIDKAGKRAWHYGLARTGAARMEVELDGKVVWQVEQNQDPYTQQPYTHMDVPFSLAPPNGGPARE